MTRSTPALLAAALLLCTGPLAAQAPAQTPAPAAVPAQAPQGVPSPSLTLEPGDVIRLQVYREPDLAGEFLIDEAGMAVLPLIGEQQVAGVPMRELRARLVQAYQVHLRNPSINVVPLRRINVLGEVQRPGAYLVDPTVTLAGAIALAGGATPAGTLRKVRIVRGDQVIRSQPGLGQTLTDADIRSGDQIYVDQRSWFERNSTFVVSTILSVTSVVTSIIIATSDGS